MKKISKYAHVTVESLPLDSIEDAPYNARTISSQALAGLTESIEHFGLLALPVVNKRDDGYRIVGGHQRAKVLREAGEKKVRCIVVEFDDDTEKQANLALNNTAIQGEFIPSLTKEILDKLRDQMGDAQGSLFRKLNFQKLIKQVSQQLGVPKISDAAMPVDTVLDDQDDVADTLPKTKAVSKPGQFYAMNGHVIHCGGLKARGSLKGFPVEHADMAITRLADTKELNQGYIDAQLGHILDNTMGAIYLVTTFDCLANVQRRFTDLQGHWSSTLMWVSQDVQPDQDMPYATAAIPVLYGWTEGEHHDFFGSKRTGNVFYLKGTVKDRMPVKLAAQLMLLSCEKGKYVLDPDIGRGETLIAAEMVGRKLLGYARTPSLCDAARKRWAEQVKGKGCKWQTLTPAL